MSTQHQFDKFKTLIQGVDRTWKGFVVVRTAYDPDPATDANQWSAVLDKLHLYASVDLDIKFLVMDDREFLEGMDYGAVRSLFKTWTKECRPCENEEGDETGWPSGVRHDCCLVIDGPALASISAAPSRPPSPPSTYGHLGKEAAEKPWVVVVDSQAPEEVGYIGGGPYMGWFRAEVSALEELIRELECSLEVHSRCRPREYDGQIPLFNGRRGAMVDPPGGVAGRYKFPRGTPRGRDVAKAWIEDIRKALGDDAVSGVRF
ncbi:uncharacterized protein CTRU02_203343 [Colletotrichum truncatum]|uniref:Uncharacterized protein n=1 Tax=Colletotrichum truncatum TaxID=5467 RepID=A0ACC3Z946_COLTU|nr:uncharacterized protein CTRU02_05730 [Colletotrichum truncatum]KAF6793475.1 hypothetical protein CTRU02_05730 [Colletotrichum truncatum]